MAYLVQATNLPFFTSQFKLKNYGFIIACQLCLCFIDHLQKNLFKNIRSKQARRKATMILRINHDIRDKPHKAHK